MKPAVHTQRQGLFKRWVRKPLLRLLRRARWYRRVAGLPDATIVSVLHTDGAHGGSVAPPRAVDAVVPVHPAGREQLPPPLPDAGGGIFGPLDTVDTPPTFVARLRDARVYGKGVAVLDAGGRVIRETTIYFSGELEDHSVFRRFWLPTPRRLTGESGMLSAPGGNTYYHWLFEVLPRFELLRLAGHEPQTLDWLIVNAKRARFQRELLEWLGVRAEQVVSSDRDKHLECERMILPSLPGRSGFPPGWVIDYLRQRVMPVADRVPRSAHERIYISRQRGSKRRLHEAAGVEALLAELGFHTVFPEEHSVAEQIRLFRDARLVLGIHGSGLSNIVFSAPGTAVVEIFEPVQTPTHYWFLSRRLGLRYRGLIGREPMRAHARGDLELNPGELRTVLEELIGGA